MEIGYAPQIPLLIGFLIGAPSPDRPQASFARICDYMCHSEGNSSFCKNPSKVLGSRSEYNLQCRKGFAFDKGSLEIDSWVLGYLLGGWL